MQPVDLAKEADAFDREVFRTPDIDHFCSSSAWVLAADAALMPRRTAFSFRSAHGYFAARLATHSAGFSYVEPIEMSWGLASPLIGIQVEALVDDVISLLATRRDWRLAIVSGVTANGPHRRALDAALPRRWERRNAQSAVRHIARLDGGIDGFLSRRSHGFRKALRKALRGAASHGLTFERVRAAEVDAAELYERIQRAEATSWKARDGVGIASGPMRAFYAAMLPRLCRLGQQRTLFARYRERDVGYVLGAAAADTYRGLQFSYDDGLAALQIGTLLQYHQILELCEEGINRYDLGTEMDYKRRWAESTMETEVLVVVR